MPYIDKDKLLQSITKDDFIKILTFLDINDYKTGSEGEVILSTAYCHEGNKMKLYYYPNEDKSDQIGLFKCYTCSDSYDLIQFILRVYRHNGKSITWHKALSLIASILERTDEVSIDSSLTQIKQKDEFGWIKRIKEAKKRGHKEYIPTQELNENFLDVFTYIPQEDWLNDGCSIEALDRYEIGFSVKDTAISIPHRDIDGRLIGIRGRSLIPEDIELLGKYHPLSVNGVMCKSPLGEHLFGMWVCKDYIKKIRKVVLVEAEKSVIQGYTFFGENSYIVGTCGSSITETQIEIIKSLNPMKVILGFDRDYREPDSFEAEVWYNKQVLKLEPFIPYCQTYLIADTQNRLEYHDSPTDKGRDTFLKLYDEKIEITMEDVNRVKTEIRKEGN